jgi:outer membrane protein
VEAERKLKFPTISAAASLGAIPAYAERLGNNHYAAAGLNVSIPWLNGGLYNARRAEAEFNAQANRRRLDEVGQRIARDVSVAVLAAQSAAQRMALTAQLLRQATLALDLAQARYELGLSSIVELSQAQLARTNAEIQSVGSKYDYQIQRALVAYHTGDLR